MRLERSELDIDPQKLDELTAWVPLNTYQVTKGGETKEKGFEDAFIPTMVFVMMLYFLIYFHGYAMTRGIIQEKTSRVMEVLLGSVSPNELMAGKILGIGLVGLTQVSIYILTGWLARTAAMFWMNLGDMERMADVIAPGKLLPVLVKGGNSDQQRWLQDNGGYIMSVGRIASITPVDREPEDAVACLAGEMTVLVQLAELIDPAAEIIKLEKELGRLKQDKDRIAGKLANSNFTGKAPENVVSRERKKLADTEDAIAKLEIQYQRIRSMIN